MSAKPDLFTHLINAYSNRYLELKVYQDLEKLFNAARNQAPAELEKIVPDNDGVSPVILLGMHRSGTTLVSKLLRESGIYMGRLRGKDTDESLFFQNINKAIYRLSGAAWDDPEPLQSFLEDETHRLVLTKIITQYCSLPQKTKTYLSPSPFSKSTLFSMPQLWGWKDPRTCFSLPLWLKIFPKSKIVYIQRNGVDVAQSLIVRNQKIGRQQPFSPNTADLSRAFQLWEKYNHQCMKETTTLSSKQLHIIKYEDLLTTPEKQMEVMIEFLEYNKPKVSINTLVNSIDGRKAYAFTKNNELIDFYQKVRESDLMRKLGYNHIL